MLTDLNTAVAATDKHNYTRAMGGSAQTVYLYPFNLTAKRIALRARTHAPVNK